MLKGLCKEVIQYSELLSHPEKIDVLSELLLRNPQQEFPSIGRTERLLALQKGLTIHGSLIQPYDADRLIQLIGVAMGEDRDAFRLLLTLLFLKMHRLVEARIVTRNQGTRTEDDLWNWTIGLVRAQEIFDTFQNTVLVYPKTVKGHSSLTVKLEELRTEFKQLAHELLYTHTELFSPRQGFFAEQILALAEQVSEEFIDQLKLQLHQINQ